MLNASMDGDLITSRDNPHVQTANTRPDIFLGGFTSFEEGGEWRGRVEPLSQSPTVTVVQGFGDMGPQNLLFLSKHSYPPPWLLRSSRTTALGAGGSGLQGCIWSQESHSGMC